MPAVEIVVTLKDETRQQIEKLAEAQHLSSETVLRLAAEEYVDRQAKRDRLTQDSLNAWRDYRETGLHLTHEEADGWLARLEAGEDIPPPECHL